VGHLVRRCDSEACKVFALASIEYVTVAGDFADRWYDTVAHEFVNAHNLPDDYDDTRTDIHNNDDGPRSGRRRLLICGDN
jgi:hypothetical protein